MSRLHKPCKNLITNRSQIEICKYIRSVPGVLNIINKSKKAEFSRHPVVWGNEPHLRQYTKSVCLKVVQISEQYKLCRNDFDHVQWFLVWKKLAIVLRFITTDNGVYIANLITKFRRNYIIHRQENQLWSWQIGIPWGSASLFPFGSCRLRTTAVRKSPADSGRVVRIQRGRQGLCSIPSSIRQRRSSKGRSISDPECRPEWRWNIKLQFQNLFGEFEGLDCRVKITNSRIYGPWIVGIVNSTKHIMYRWYMQPNTRIFHCQLHVPCPLFFFVPSRSERHWTRTDRLCRCQCIR